MACAAAQSNLSIATTFNLFCSSATSAAGLTSVHQLIRSVHEFLGGFALSRERGAN
jgi:hypothetical protein